MTQHLRKCSLIVVYFAFAALIGTSQSHAVTPFGACGDLFQPATERQKLLDMGERFYAEPAAKRVGFRKVDRRQFRDPVFTETATAILAKLEATYVELAARPISVPYSDTPEQAKSYTEKRFEFARLYIEKLKSKNARDRSDSSRSANEALDNTNGWIVELGYHAAVVGDMMADNGFQDAYHLRIGEEPRKSKSMEAFVEKEMKDHAWEVQDAAHPYFPSIPTMKWFSAEGVVELLAHGVRVYGLYRNDDLASRGNRQNSQLYNGHDHRHAAVWSEAILDLLEPEYKVGRIRQFYYRQVREYGHGYRDPNLYAKDPVTSPTFQRIHARLQAIVQRVKQLPELERKAGFATLFFMFHEYPLNYYRVLAAPAVLKSGDLVLRDVYDVNKFALQLGRTSDLGHDFRGRDPGSILALGNQVVSEAAAGL